MITEFISKESISCIAFRLHYRTKNVKVISPVDPWQPKILKELQNHDGKLFL